MSLNYRRDFRGGNIAKIKYFLPGQHKVNRENVPTRMPSRKESVRNVSQPTPMTTSYRKDPDFEVLGVSDLNISSGILSKSPKKCDKLADMYPKGE